MWLFGHTRRWIKFRARLVFLGEVRSAQVIGSLRQIFGTSRSSHRERVENSGEVCVCPPGAPGGGGGTDDEKERGEDDSGSRCRKARALQNVRLLAMANSFSRSGHAKIAGVGPLWHPTDTKLDYARADV